MLHDIYALLVPTAAHRAALIELFIDIVFKEQQSEYAEQGIPWVHVDYADNAPALALLEGPQGVLALLEEQ